MNGRHMSQIKMETFSTNIRWDMNRPLETAEYFTYETSGPVPNSEWNQVLPVENHDRILVLKISGETKSAEIVRQLPLNSTVKGALLIIQDGLNKAIDPELYDVINQALKMKSVEKHLELARKRNDKELKVRDMIIYSDFFVRLTRGEDGIWRYDPR